MHLLMGMLVREVEAMTIPIGSQVFHTGTFKTKFSQLCFRRLRKTKAAHS